MQTLIILIGLASAAIVFLLIPALFGRDDAPSTSISDSDDSRLNGSSFGDRGIGESVIECEVKHKPVTKADFIKKLIWIAVIIIAVFVVYFIVSPYQNCLAKSEKHWCVQHTSW